MVLPSDWAFNPEHTDLDETGRLNSGEDTLLDFACTLAITTPGQLPEDPFFGAGLGDQLGRPMPAARELGEQLRGRLLDDERIRDVSTDATTSAGRLTLPVRLEASTDASRLSGPLTPALIEDILADFGEEADLG